MVATQFEVWPEAALAVADRDERDVRVMRQRLGRQPDVDAAVERRHDRP